MLLRGRERRKRTNRENPGRVPEQRKIPEKSGKSRKGQKRTKKEGQVQIGKPPRLAAFELSDPRNRNHKSLAIGNHNFEVASFSRSKIAVKSQCRNYNNRIGPKTPLTLLQALLFWKKQGFFPQTSKGFSLRGTVKSLEKRGKRTKKQGKSENEQSKEIEKKKNKDWRVRVTAVRNHTLVVATISGGFPDLCDASETLQI